MGRIRRKSASLQTPPLIRFPHFLTLVRHWYARDCPEVSHNKIGSFTEWAKIVSGVLDGANVPGFLDNLTEMYDRMGEELLEWAEFFAYWHERIGSTPITSQDLTQSGWIWQGPLPESLQDVRDRAMNDNFSGAARVIGTALRKHRGMGFENGLVLRQGQSDGHAKIARWYVEESGQHE